MGSDHNEMREIGGDRNVPYLDHGGVGYTGAYNCQNSSNWNTFYVQILPQED